MKDALRTAFCLLATWLFWRTGTVVGTQERALAEKLLHNYHSWDRPVMLNKSEPTLVTISLGLVQIFDMDVKRQAVVTSVWLKQTWIDPSLRWNKTLHHDIEEIALSPDDVWVPDTVLLNNVDESKRGKPVGRDNPVLVNFNGTVRWLAPIIIRSSCKLNVRYFPFDEQFCRLKFASWTYSKFQMVIEPEHNDVLQNYTESSEWSMEHVYTLKSSSQETHSIKQRKAAVTYVIHIQRKMFYYFVYLITPCMLTSFMTLIIFVLPPESGERMVVGMTTLLALIVFYMLASTRIPETSEVVPLIGRYYSLTIMEVSCALCMVCVVLRFHHQNTSFGKVPKWVKVIILRFIAKAVRYEIPESDQDSEDSYSGILADGNSQEEGQDNRRRLPREPSGIAMMAQRLVKKREDDKILDEWQLAARVINRLFMIIYLVAIFTSIVGIFLLVPGLLTSRPEPPLSDD